jgi:hypothetical protein
MLVKNTSAALMYLFIFASVGSFSVYAATNQVVSPSSNAELFGLRFNDLPLSKLESQLRGMGIVNYPSYKEGVTSYSLGPEGILGVTNATIFTNTSGYIHQALLSGVVDSSEKRQSLGKLLETKYGVPVAGYLSEGIGKARWIFKEGTMIELRNNTFDVSITYVDERPRVQSRSGKIDVEALSRKNQ